jgi:hypothetical protein
VYEPLALAWATPDHPWVDQHGARLRVAMTVGARASALPGGVGRFATVTAECGSDCVSTETERGVITPHLQLQEAVSA